AAATGATSGVTLVVVAGPLNVRGGPGKQFAPVGSVKKGAHLSLLEQRPGWDRVSATGGLTGWVASQYVAPLGATLQQPSQADVTIPGATRKAVSIGSARVIASVLNVRTAPNDKAQVVSV